MKVLVIAYACEPGRGSEPSVGWNWALQIARNFDTWVITRKSNKEAIENRLSKSKINNIHFEYVDLPRWSLFWKKGEMSIRIYYMIWQFLAYLKARKLNKKHNFNIIHHITFLVDWLPPLAAFLPGNFVWGPIGGTSRELLTSFFPEFGFKNSLYELFRSLYLNLFTLLNPLIYMAKKRARIILLSIEDDTKRYRKNLRNKIRIYPAIGISPSEVSCEENKFPEFTVFITGRMVHWKGFSLAIKGFKKFSDNFPGATLLIGGKGPEEKKLKKLVNELGISDKVKFLGFLPSRKDVTRILSQSHVFLLPSLRDAPLVSFLEAMACGVPIICLDTPSQRSLVCDKCGIRVPRVNPEITADLIGKALMKLAQNPELRKEMGTWGRRTALERFSWDQKGKFVEKLYLEVLNQQNENPHSS